MALVVLLRGVNVGGHRVFRPTVLTSQLKHLGAVNVGAAGTLVIRQPISQAELRAELGRKLPFEAEIMICPGREILQMISDNPFASAPPRSDVTRFVSVLSRPPRTALSTPVRFPADGKWLLKLLAREGRYVFGVYRRHMKVIAYLGKLDGLFGAPATTRSWNTMTAVAKVLALDVNVEPRRARARPARRRRDESAR